MQSDGVPTSRAGYLLTLREKIGPKPDDRRWVDEWERMNREYHVDKCRREALAEAEDRLAGDELAEGWQAKAEADLDSTTFMFTAYRKADYDSLAKLRVDSRYKGEIDQLENEAGWTRDDAEAWVILGLRRDMLAKSLATGDRRFAASIYAISEALLHAPQLPAYLGEGALPPPLFRHLDGKHSLAASDPQWSHVKEWDRNGFRGLTSAAIVRAMCSPTNFSSRGWIETVKKRDAPTQYAVCPPHPPLASPPHPPLASRPHPPSACSPGTICARGRSSCSRAQRRMSTASTRPSCSRRTKAPSRPTRSSACRRCALLARGRCAGWSATLRGT